MGNDVCGGANQACCTSGGGGGFGDYCSQSGTTCIPQQGQDMCQACGQRGQPCCRLSGSFTATCAMGLTCNGGVFSGTCQ
jgi:hypothetical protein